MHMFDITLDHNFERNVPVKIIGLWAFISIAMCFVSIYAYWDVFPLDLARTWKFELKYNDNAPLIN